MLTVRILDNPNMDPRPIGRIDDAWVDPDHRRKGMMRELTEACCRFLEERDVLTVMLDWAIRNVPSVDCWQNLGFEPLITMGFTSPARVLGRGRATN
jgi:ribosomal protein S18 acetylase RimI-like enzyme